MTSTKTRSVVPTCDEEPVIIGPWKNVFVHRRSQCIWYEGEFHSHSDVSAFNRAVTEIAEELSQHGYLLREREAAHWIILPSETPGWVYFGDVHVPASKVREYAEVTTEALSLMS